MEIKERDTFAMEKPQGHAFNPGLTPDLEVRAQRTRGAVLGAMGVQAPEPDRDEGHCVCSELPNGSKRCSERKGANV